MSKKLKRIVFVPRIYNRKNYELIYIFKKNYKLLNSKGVNTYILVTSDRNKITKDKINTIIQIKIHKFFTKYLSYLSKKLFIFYQSYLINKTK